MRHAIDYLTLAAIIVLAAEIIAGLYMVAP